MSIFQIVCSLFRWLQRKNYQLWNGFLRGFFQFLTRVRSLVWRKEGGNKPESSPVEDEETGEERDFEVPERDFEVPERDFEVPDEFYCDYDSTWETEPGQAQSSPGWTPRSTGIKSFKFKQFENAARDMQRYRHKCKRRNRTPHQRKFSHDNKPNLNFYLGLQESLPDGVFISDYHDIWHGDYYHLEHVHTFIQWLFPLEEPGVNYQAVPLTEEEIEEFCESDIAKHNLLKSYKLMLDFYGIELVDEKTGKVKRAKNWQERFNNMNSHTHNNLRITRILKCLGLLGYAHYQAPLVHFFLEETLINKELPRVKDSVLNYFLFAVLDKTERRKLVKFAWDYYPDEEFVWCSKKIQKGFSGKYHM